MPVKTIKNNNSKNIRADVLLASAYPEYSRSALTKLFDLGNIKAKNILKPGDRIAPGQIITADITPLQKPIKSINLPVLYEDNNVIVVDKPVGIISHARGKYWDEPSVASFIRGRVSGMSGERSGIVHRLDRATSGVMICARNPDALKFLQKQFANKKTKKTYLAIVQGILEPKSALIDISIGRNPKKPQTFIQDKNGRSAQTQYKTIKFNKKYSLLKLTPKTGRTHQLRVHLKYLKHPIVGDDLYGGSPADRLYLHAASLYITLPNGQGKTFKSLLPKTFDKLVS